MKHKFEKYCKDYENIENYQKALADNFKGWCCHHRKGVDIPTEELQALDMYYNRPAEELVFIKLSEHSSLHKPSDDTKKKMSAAHKGENNPMYGKQGYWKGKRLSEETKNKMSEAKKGKKVSDEAKKKIGAAKKGNKYHLGKHWYNNGKINKRAYECPEGFVPGMLR